MRLTVVGCSGSAPGPESPASCYLVEEDGFALCLDLGSGALGPLQRYVAPHRLGGVVLSHLHPDHCLDLCGLYVAREHGPTRAADRLPVHGPTGVAERVVAAYGPTGGTGIRDTYAFTEVGRDPWQLGPFRITAYEVAHPVLAFAYRVEAGGRTLAYSGDTAPCASLVDALRGADLALVEACWSAREDNPPGIHLTGAEAGRLAQDAAVRRLVLTHIPPWGDARQAVAEARAGFAGPVEAARPGAVYEV